MRKETKRFKPVVKIEVLEEMAAVGASKRQVCAFFRISEEQLDTWLHHHYDITWDELVGVKFEKTLLDLRQSQFRMAKKNAQMSMFLGKNYLGQRSDPVAVGEFNGELTKIVKLMRQRAETQDGEQREYGSLLLEEQAGCTD